LSALLQKGFKLLVSVKCQKQTFCATAKTGTPSPRRSARQLNKLREIRRNLPRFIP
jgi:hypothetical protein